MLLFTDMAPVRAQHTIVRDQLTTAHERATPRGNGAGVVPGRDAIEVDAIVSTIGFPARPPSPTSIL